MGRNSGGLRIRKETAQHYSVIRQTREDVAEATRRISSVFEDVARVGHPTDGSPIKVGTLSPDIVRRFEKLEGAKIEGYDLYTDARALLHHRTGTKAKRGKVVSERDLTEMPSKIGGMDVYENNGCLVFTDYKNKFIVEVNRTVKVGGGKQKSCCHISSSAVIDKREFGRYRIIKKK